LEQPAGGFWSQDGELWAKRAIGIIMNAFIIIATVVVIVDAPAFGFVYPFLVASLLASSCLHLLLALQPLGATVWV